MDAVRAEIEKGHAEAVQRLQAWIREPSIAAENRNMAQGCETMMRMLRECGFQRGEEGAHGRASGRIRHARRGRGAHAGRLLYV
jgi:hypothetical protein